MPTPHAARHASRATATLKARPANRCHAAGGATLQRTPRATALAAGLVLTLVLTLGAVLAPPAAADHNGSQPLRCSYVLANGFAQWSLHTGDPGDLTGSDWLEVGGCHWVFPASGGDPGMVNPQRTVAGEWDQATASIVDDVYGAGAVGGLLCNDGDGDGICGETEEGEERVAFCAFGPALDSDVDWDGDGHDDLGASLTLLVNGHAAQMLRCGSTAGATTGGVLDPAAGAFVTLAD